jgi:hypothetical protein
MFALALQTFFGEKIPCQKSANLHPRQGNLLHRNNFSLFTKQNRLEISWKHFAPLFNMRLLCRVAHMISAEETHEELVCTIMQTPVPLKSEI